MKHRHILALGVVICLLMSRGAHAQYLPNDTTINDNSFSGNFIAFIAGYANSTDELLHQNGTSPTISIVDGAFFTGSGVGKSGSTINMSGGTAGNLSAVENATVNMSGGLAFGLNAGGEGKANMSGGAATGVGAQQNGILTVTGGQILSSVQLFDSGVAKISGVTIGQTVNGNLVATLFQVRDQSTLELNGATVGTPDQGAIQAFNTAKVKLDNTSLLGSILGFGQNTIEITGGNLSGGVSGYNLKITDGILGGGVSLQGGDGAQATISQTHASDLTVGGTGLATMSVTGSTITGGGSALTGGVLSASSTSFGGNVSASGGPAGPGTIILNGGGVGGKVSANNGIITATDVSISGDVTAVANGVLGSITLNGGTVGGNVSATGNLSAIPNAIVQINGSNITGSVTANIRGAITLVSGSVGGNVVASTGPLTLMEVQGGTISGNALASARDAELRMSGGTVMGDVRGTNRGTVKISGGTVTGNLSGDRATVNLSAGTVQGKLTLTNFATGTQSGGAVLGEASLACVSFTMSGGSIAKDVTVLESCIFTMQNGMLGQNLFAQNQSSVDMSGGQVGTLGANEQSTVSVRGGSITGVAEVADTATLNASGTAIFNSELNAFVGGTLNFSGGSAKSVGITDQATLNLSGSAFILETLSAFKTATVNLNGGKVTGNLLANDSSVIAMAGGLVLGGALTEEQSTLVVQGGAISGNLIARNSSVIRLNGGSFTGNASSEDQSTLVVEGTLLIGDGVDARDSSKLFIKGGGINGDAFAAENATLTLSGSGFISGNLKSTADATVNMSGGSVGGDLLVQDNGKLVLGGGNVAGALIGTSKGDITMTGGTVGRIEMSQDQPGGGISIGGGHVTGNVDVFNSAGVLLIAGTVGGDIQPTGNSTVEIESIAAVAGNLNAFGFSTVNVRGGSIGVGPLHGRLGAQANATVNLSGGTVGGDLTGFDNSIINMSGGTVFGRGIFQGNSKFNFSGGSILGGIQAPPGLRAAADEVLHITALDNATINIQGVDLLATLIDPNHEGTSSLYQLSGLLADGTSISGGSMVIQNGTAATFGLIIVPHWAADADGNWSGETNWVQGIPNAPGAVARFLDKITADRTITVDGNFTVGQMVFNDTDHYTLAAAPGGSITLQGPAPNINVVGGTHQINVPLILTANTEIAVATSATLNFQGNLSIPAATTITKTGPGTLRISGPQTHEANADLTLSGGTLNLASDAGAPASISAAAVANLNLQISGGDTATILDASQDLRSLTISHANAGNQSLDLHSPSTPGSFNALRIYAADLVAAKASLWEAIQNANIAGSPNPTDGIFDTGRPAHPGTAVGLAQLTDAHGDPYLQVRLTRLGDLNLDGAVTIADFIDLASHFNATNVTWQEGDLNYDGSVTISDFIDLASNFNTNYAGESFPISAADHQTLSDFALANGISAVPEPASALSIALATMLLWRGFNFHQKPAFYRTN